MSLPHPALAARAQRIGLLPKVGQQRMGPCFTPAVLAWNARRSWQHVARGTWWRASKCRRPGLRFEACHGQKWCMARALGFEKGLLRSMSSRSSTQRGGSLRCWLVARSTCGIRLSWAVIWVFVRAVERPSPGALCVPTCIKSTVVALLLSCSPMECLARRVSRVGGRGLKLAAHLATRSRVCLPFASRVLSAYEPPRAG